MKSSHCFAFGNLPVALPFLYYFLWRFLLAIFDLESAKDLLATFRQSFFAKAKLEFQIVKGLDTR